MNNSLNENATEGEKPGSGTEQQPDEEPKQEYDREAKIKELLEQDEKRSPWADDFMGF